MSSKIQNPKSEAFRILILDDIPADAELMQYELRKSGIDFESKYVDERATFLKALKDFSPDIVLSDFSMPRFTGLEALELVKELYPAIPLIIVTGSMNEETAVACMKTGAADYVLKENLIRLGSSVAGVLEMASLKREKEKAQKKLQESERYFRSLLHGMHEDILVIDRDYRITDVNNTFVSSARKSRKDVIGRRCYEISHGLSEPCSEHGEACLLGEVFETGEPRSCLHEHMADDGSSVFVDILYSPLKDENGNVTNVIEAMRDMTNFYQTQEALKRSEEKYRTLLSNLPGVVFRGYADWSVEAIDSKVETMTGYSVDEFNSGRMKWIDIIVKEDIDNVKNKFIQALKTDRSYIREYRIKTMAGELRWIQERGQIVCDETGNVEYIDGVIFDITKRIKSEEALLDSEEKFRSISTTAQDAIIMMDGEGNASYWNEAAEKMFGYSGKEVLGRNLHALITPQRFHEAFRKGFAGFKMTGQGVIVNKTTEMEAVKKDGSEFPIGLSLSATRIKGEWHATGLIRDITERKQAENALHRLTQDLKKRVKELDCLYNISKLDEIEAIELNDIYQKAVNIMPLSWQYPDITCARISCGSREVRTENFAETMWKLTADIYVDRMKTGVLEVCYLEEMPERDEGPFLKEERALITLIGHRLGRITERMSAQKALAESEEKYRHLVQSTSDWVWACDPEGRQTFSNDAVKKILGYEINEIEGNLSEKFMHPEDAKKIRKWFKQSVKTKTGWKRSVVRWLHKDGSIKFLESTAQPVIDPHGNLTGFIGVDRDVTERMHHEQEREMLYETLKSMNLVLEEKVEKRTRALESAVYEANLANESKSIFLANMSHEIRTPLNAILGLSRLTLRTKMSPNQEDYLKKIRSSGNALLQIINDILDFSKIEAGKLDMEQIDFNIEDVLNNVATIVGHEAQRKGIEFNFITDTDIPPMLKGDPLRLGQVLGNLSNNAVKFTDRGEIVLSVSIVDKNEKQATLQFSIKDTGIGIKQAQIEKLFKAFSQVDSSMTRKFGGTGLGLAISRRLVELMEGKVWAKSEVGKGSEFFFTATFPISSSPVKPRYSIPPDICGMKVLIVDDNVSAQKMLERMLDKMTFLVSTANSGEEAVLKVEQADKKGSPYKLVIADWKMPVTDGIETIRRIKTNSKISQIPTAILISGFGIESADEDAKRAGADGFLSKPLTASTLYNKIMECFCGKEDDVPLLLDDSRLFDENVAKIRGAKILLAEDNEINQQVAREILENEGLIVAIANTGKEAVDMIAEYGMRNAETGELPYDLVLMDIQMPEMDGYTATREIRKWESDNPSSIANHQSPIPIVAMTAHAMTGDREKCLAAGMNDYITKPIDHNDLFATLVRWIEPGERETRSPREAVFEDADNAGFPETLPGIDVRDGLTRLGGNRGLFRQLLVKFSARHWNTVEEIITALESKDREKAVRLAHTLRGLAGNLGARELQTAAAGLEAALTAEREELNELLEHVSVTLKRVLSGIASLEKAEPDGRTTDLESVKAGDISTVAPLLEKLKTLLEENNTNAKKKLEQVAEAMKTSTLKDELGAMRRFLEKYNFEKALEMLCELREKLGIRD
ncbi:MAG: PAS domain S-box protein [Pseudomonadota bacterium]